VSSREDLLREIAEAGDGEATVGLVREKKETAVKVKIEAPRRSSRGRPA